MNKQHWLSVDSLLPPMQDTLRRRIFLTALTEIAHPDQCVPFEHGMHNKGGSGLIALNGKQNDASRAALILATNIDPSSDPKK